MTPVTVAFAGFGNRAERYAQWIDENPELCRVVAIAEPRAVRRERVAEKYGLGANMAVADWRALAQLGRVADAIIISLPDQDRVGPVEEFLKRGYDTLLEKPIAVNEEDCRSIVAAATKNNSLFAVCHSLRYTPHTQTIKEAVTSGRIGEVISIQHIEPVDYLHYAHSFVRGNWKKEAESSSMLLQKSCHDMDLLQYWVDSPIRRVSSFGRLSHFRPANKPAGTADRCIDCKIQDECAFSATRQYLPLIREGHTCWPIDVVTEEFTELGVRESLEVGPYGSCVYNSGNDVVDHQVVNMEFESGVTGSFTMVGFGWDSRRRTRIFGTQGEVEGDLDTVKIAHFPTRSYEEIEINPSRPPGSMAPLGSGRNIAVNSLLSAFIKAVKTGDRSGILSGPEESLNSHLAVFAAEKSRREGGIVDVSALTHA